MTSWKCISRASLIGFLSVSEVFTASMCAADPSLDLDLSAPLTLSVPSVAASPTDRFILETGAGLPLTTIKLTLDIPQLRTKPLLEFNFGFATDETNAPNPFFDSFSLTLQGREPAMSALFLTADLSGVKWAPAHPGGLTVNPDQITRNPIAFPDLANNLDQRLAYAVSLPIPPELTGHSATLFLDLFDNQNSLDSLAFLTGLVLDTEADTNIAPYLVLQSSASAGGPYADETGVEHDSVAQILTVPLFGKDRFYRIRSDSQVRITNFRLAADEQIYGYEFAAPTVTLQSAVAVDGPYTDDTEAQLDLAARTISVSRPSAARFYRIRSNVRVHISSTNVAADRVILAFEYQPTVFGLQSSSLVNGPYAAESYVVIEHSQQVMKIPRHQTARFYRIRSDTPRVISSIRPAGDKLIISYSAPGPNLVVQSAPTVTGPYQDETGLVTDATARTLTLTRSGPMRFYRFRSDSPQRISGIRVTPSEVILTYD